MSSSIGDAIMNNQSAILHCLPSSFSQPKSMEELRETLVLAQMELLTTRRRAEEELRNRDNQLSHLKFLLCRANLEKQESGRSLQRLLSDKFVLQHKILQLQQQKHAAPEDEPGIRLDYSNAFSTSLVDRQQDSKEKLGRFFLLNQHQSTPPPPPPPPPLSGISTVEDEGRRRLEYNSSSHNNGFSDSDESIVSSPVFVDPIAPAMQLAPPSEQDAVSRLAVDQPLPEKGKLLVAVMKAGPLLQTVMLAGALPQWRHPPPPLDSYQIPAPPVAMPSSSSSGIVPVIGEAENDEGVRRRVTRKRELCGGGSDFGQNKHPRFVV